MTRYIENFITPDRLLLSWQAQDSETRSRFVVAELINQNDTVTLNYLTDSSDYQMAVDHGFIGHPAFPVKNGSSFSNHVLNAFERRLPPRNRSDFPRYLELRAISPNQDLDTFSLLGYVGAKLPDDGFEIVHPFDDVALQFEVIIEIAGFRHNSEIDIELINIGDQVEFISEPENSHDSSAVKIISSGKLLGYVDHGRANLFQQQLTQGRIISGEIHRKNGTADRPLVYVFAQF